MTEGGGLQAGVVVAEAGGTLPLRENPADNALARRGLDDVRDIEQLARQDSVVNLKLPSKPVIDNVEHI